MKQLFTIDYLPLDNLPEGIIKYGKLDFAKMYLPTNIISLIEMMAFEIKDPRISYHCRTLKEGECFGHGKWHCDGKQVEGEIHRLLTVGGEPTEGEDGFILTAKTVWEYSGVYKHRAKPTNQPCKRLMLRVSQTEMLFRNNFLEAFPPLVVG
jgi:hypothetical protein